MGSCGTMNGDQIACNGFHIIRPRNPLKLDPRLSPTWFDLRVFYVRVTNDLIDDSTPESLKLNHIPIDPETLLEVNGTRFKNNSDRLSSILRRDRVDKNSEEVTFVSTDAVRFTGSVKFEVFNRDTLVLSGVLEPSSLRCKSELVACSSLLKAKHDAGLECIMPVVEVYAAGCISGAPVILTETLQLNTQKKNKKVNGYTLDFQEAEYMEEEDGELSWFNAGVRVGVGIGLGVFLGVGLGAGLLFRTYRATTRTLKRRFL